jgi:integrase/recombinase XerD
MPPRRYKNLEDCRDLIVEYCNELSDSTSDDDDNMRNSASTQRYLQDLRWFDSWLDGEEIESPVDVETRNGAKLMRSLNDEFSGTTGRYRWDRIFAFYDWMVAIDMIPSNPLTYHDNKKSSRGLSKDTQQSQEMGDGERYALSESEIRQMEENVGNPTLRNTLLIRLMWQTGMRRSEVSELELNDIVREEREITISSDVSKNDEERIVGYQRSLDGLLSSWIDKGRRDQWVSGDEDMPFLFVSTHGNQLAPESINEVVRKSAISAGINRKLDYTPANGGSRWKITAHSIRHGFGSHMVHNTDATLFEVSQMMGHSSVSVTESTYIEHEPDAGLDSHKKFGPD